MIEYTKAWTAEHIKEIVESAGGVFIQKPRSVIALIDGVTFKGRPADLADELRMFLVTRLRTRNPIN